jgi:hypothetical protein
MECFAVLFCCSVCLLANSFHLLEGQAGVKFIFVFEAWLKAVDMCLNGGSNASKGDRSVSIKYETAGTADGFTGEDFQNTGTFMVVKFSVFAKSSAYKTHYARRVHRILGNRTT